MLARTQPARLLRRPHGARAVSGFANWDFSWIRNEVPKTYAPGTPDRAKLRQEVDKLYARHDEVPCVINGEDVFTGDTATQVMPTEHGHAVCTYHKADQKVIANAIDAAMSPAAREWSMWPFEDRAAVFLKAADLAADKYREEMNAAIMLGTGKTPREADIDNSEISDFFRFGVRNAAQIYDMQPPSLYAAQGYWNRIEHRALEGFSLAIAPFNFCALGANLSGIPALMGNTVVFKPSSTAVHESHLMMKIYKEAGLPPGVINFIPCSGRDMGEVALACCCCACSCCFCCCCSSLHRGIPRAQVALPHTDLGGVNFTGSTGLLILGRC